MQNAAGNASWLSRDLKRNGRTLVGVAIVALALACGAVVAVAGIAHTLPLLFGVEVAAVMGAEPPTGKVLPEVKEPTFSAPGLTATSGKRIGIETGDPRGFDLVAANLISSLQIAPIAARVYRDIIGNKRGQSSTPPNTSVMSICLPSRITASCWASSTISETSGISGNRSSQRWNHLPGETPATKATRRVGRDEGSGSMRQR